MTLRRESSFPGDVAAAEVKGLSRGLTSNLSLKTLPLTYTFPYDPSQRLLPIHGKPAFDPRQVHLEQVWQSLEREVERAKNARRRADSLERALTRGELVPARRVRQAAHQRRVKEAAAQAQYTHAPTPAAAVVPEVPPSPVPLPEPTFLRTLRQRRVDAQTSRTAADHISVLPNLPEAAELAKRTWASPAFQCRPARSSASSLAAEQVEAIDSVRAISISQGEASAIVDAWKDPAADRKAAQLLRSRSRKLASQKSARFVPYDPDMDDTWVLYGPQAEAFGAVPASAPAAHGPAHPRALTAIGSTRGASPSLESSPLEPRGSTSQSMRRPSSREQPVRVV